MTPQKSSRFYGVMVSTLDSESSDPSSNLGRTWDFELSSKCAQCSTPPSNLHRQVLSLVHGFGQKRLQNVNVTPLDPYVRTEKNSNGQCFESIVFFRACHPITRRFYGVMVSTLDSESSDPSSNLGRTKDFELSAKCAQCSTPPSNLHRQECSTLPSSLPSRSSSIPNSPNWHIH